MDTNFVYINESLDNELKYILYEICLYVCKQYDMSPILINKMINDDEYLYYCKFIKIHDHSKMTILLNNFKAKYNQVDSMGKMEGIPLNEYDKCGHLVSTYENGYIEYCNIHKYLHDSQKHVFVKKTEEQISTELYYTNIYNIYNMYINSLFDKLKTLFMVYLHKNYEIIHMKIGSEELDLHIENMKTNPHIFKTKMVYKHINLLSEKNIDDNDSYNYIKVGKPILNV
jgi:hypothetical protein